MGSIQVLYSMAQLFFVNVVGTPSVTFRLPIQTLLQILLGQLTCLVGEIIQLQLFLLFLRRLVRLNGYIPIPGKGITPYPTP